MSTRTRRAPRRPWASGLGALAAVAAVTAVAMGPAWAQGELDDDTTEMPAGHPPTGGAPAGHGAPGQAPQMFQPPPDLARDDASVPAGTISATIQSATGDPIAGAQVTLAILKSSVAQGESRETRSGATRDDGSVVFEGLSTGSMYSYRVVTNEGGAMYGSEPFTLAPSAGKKVLLHVYSTVTDPNQIRLGMDGTVFVGLSDGKLQVEHMVNVFNLDARAWVADHAFKLPEGFKAFSTPEEEVEPLFKEVDGVGAKITGTIKPGRHSGTFRYTVDLDGTETQTIRIEMPPLVKQAQVVTQAGPSMSLMVAGFPKADRVTQNDGRKFLVTRRMVSPGEAGLPVLEITLTGLPTPGNGRWLAVGLGTVALAGGLAYALSRRRTRELPEDTKEDLLEAREALFGELLALEKAHHRGDVGPRTYARLRAALLDALSRIVGQLEASAPAPATSHTASRHVDDNDDDDDDDDDNDDDDDDDDDDDRGER